MNDSIDFQLVTENLSSMVEPHLRVVDYIPPFWNFVVVFLAMVFMVLNKQLFPLRFRMMLSAYYQSSDSMKMTREWNPVISVNGLSVVVVYVALLALIIQKIVLIYSGNTMLYGSFGFYLDICAFIMVFLISQHLAINFFGWIFGMENATTHQEVTHISAMTILNIVMMVMGLVILFYPVKIILIITSSILLIITGIRIIKTFFEFQILSRMNLLNIFLYFCTLEIIPLAVAITMLCRLIVTNCVL